MSVIQPTRSSYFRRAFELLCFGIILLGGVIFVRGALGRSEAIAEKAVQQAVDRAETALTGQVSESLEEILKGGSELAQEILKSDDSSPSEKNSHRSSKTRDLPLDRMDKVFRQATRVFAQAADEVMGLDEEEEQRVGRDVHRMIAAQQRLLDSPLEHDRIERLALPLLQQRTRPGIEYRFFVIDSEIINAFAHVGGYVYLNQGLLDATINNDDALQFVLGHEIAHSDLRHCSQNMTAMVRADEILPGAGSLAAIAYRAISLGYSQEHELESDLWSYRTLLKEGKSHEQALQGLLMLQKEFGDDDQQTHRNRRINPLESIEAHFRTHPPIQSRIDQLQRQSSRSD